MFKLYAAIGAAILIAILAGLLKVERARAERLKVELRAMEQTAKGFKASFREAEARRATEATQARQAMSEAQASCTARIDKARKAGAAISSIINKPVKYDAAHCPVRSLVDADSLRDAISPD